MGYTIDDYTFWISVGVIVGLILYVISKAHEWARDVGSDVEENRKRIEELERKLEMFGSRKL
jgi:hypothetical protein